MEPLDLDRRRELGDLLSTALDAWTRHFGVFFTLALIVVAPVGLLVDGLWNGMLADIDAEAPVAGSIVSALLYAFVVPPIITAVHVVAVLDLGAGEAPGVGRSLRRALPFLVPVLLAVVLYTLGGVVMSLLLILPGIWFLVKFYFGPQAVIVDGVGPLEALARSGRLVKGHWWRTLGILFLFGIIAAVGALLVGGVLGGIAGALDSGWLLVVALILANSLVYSFTALAGTLLFFDLRTRRSAPAAA